MQKQAARGGARDQEAAEGRLHHPRGELRGEPFLGQPVVAGHPQSACVQVQKVGMSAQSCPLGQASCPPGSSRIAGKAVIRSSPESQDLTHASSSQLSQWHHACDIRPLVEGTQAGGDQPPWLMFILSACTPGWGPGAGRALNGRVEDQARIHSWRAGFPSRSSTTTRGLFQAGLRPEVSLQKPQGGGRRSAPPTGRYLLPGSIPSSSVWRLVR